ncbi:hypothetical protein Tco_1545394, partial [Tanacetum coccineum]
AWPLFFCLTGAVISCIPSLCLTSILGTPLMLPPIIMVCSGHSGLIATFTFSTGSRVGTSVWRTIWISSDLALSVMIVATPALVRNFIIPCAVDGTAPSARIPGHPRIPLMPKIIKGGFEKIKDVKVEDVPLTCDAPLEVFNNEVSRLRGMDDDLFTYEVEVANIPCDSKMDANSEQEADDDMGYDPSDVAFTEWLGSNFFNYMTMDHYTMKAL